MIPVLAIRLFEQDRLSRTLCVPLWTRPLHIVKLRPIRAEHALTQPVPHCRKLMEPCGGVNRPCQRVPATWRPPVNAVLPSRAEKGIMIPPCPSSSLTCRTKLRQSSRQVFEAGVVTRDRTTCAAWSRASIRSSKSVSALIDMHDSGAGAVEMGA